MDCSMPGFPVFHHLPGFVQTHVHWVSDAIYPYRPLLSPFPPAFNLSQHQGLFQWVSSSYQVAKVLELQLQHQCFQWISGTDFLQDWLVWSPCNPRDSQESSPTPQFKSINSSMLSLLEGEGNSNPLQYSCLENPVDRGAWWAAVHRVAQSQTWMKQLSNSSREGEMAKNVRLNSVHILSILNLSS